MNVQRLVAMANDIANFFGSDPDKAAAAEQVAGHMKKFWEPRMRAEIRRHVSAGGEGLSSIAIQAVKKLAKPSAHASPPGLRSFAPPEL